MANIKDLIEESKQDIKIDFLALENEMTRNPNLLGKWLEYHQVQRSKLVLIETEHKRLVALKTKYYMGKMDDDQRTNLGWELEGTKVLKADLFMWMDADDEVILSKHKFEAQAQIVHFIEKTIDQISEKKWTIKNYIDWKKWTEGG
jgi:hypothetical protein